jgi:hypothetical protein
LPRFIILREHFIAEKHLTNGSYVNATLMMWHHYRVELYPHVGQGCGIFDENGNEQMFPAAFRKTRDTLLPKGIIQIIKEDVEYHD